MIAAAALLIAGGCARSSSDQLRDAEAGAPTTTRAPGGAPPASTSLPTSSGSSHRTTVVTDAGRIEATAVDGDLVVDIAPTDGWEFVVERRPQHVRVASTSGNRRVVVDLRSTSNGIAQEVTASS